MSHEPESKEKKTRWLYVYDAMHSAGAHDEYRTDLIRCQFQFPGTSSRSPPPERLQPPPRNKPYEGDRSEVGGKVNTHKSRDTHDLT